MGDDIGEESSRFISTLIWFRLGVKTDSEDGRWKKLGNEAFNCCLWITGFSTSLLDTKVAGCDGAHGDEATTGETGNIDFYQCGSAVGIARSAARNEKSKQACFKALVLMDFIFPQKSGYNGLKEYTSNIDLNS